jgi:cob(I)alamin adenosyltransferase
LSKNKVLYELIHSLTGAEKRFFKIQAKRHTTGVKNNYVRLFDLFEKQHQFDENHIENMAQKASFVKYFAAEKNYLYQLILDSLDVFHKESSIDRQISKFINMGRILMEKKLDEQGEKILEKARKLSLQHNRHENLIPINQLLIRKSFDKETLSPNYLENKHQEEVWAVQQLQRKLFYRQVFDKLHLTRRVHGDISHEDYIDYLIRDFPHVVEPIPTSFSHWDSDVYYLLSRLEFYRLARKRNEGRTVALLLIQLMEENRSKITGEYIDRYSYCLYVFLIIHAYETNEERDTAMKKLRHLDQYIDAAVTKREHARTFEFYHTTLTDIYLKSKEYSKIHEILPDFERAETIYEEHITPSFNIAMHYNIAALFFGNEEYKQSLKWGNKVANAALVFRKDIYHFLRTLNLIIHLELENFDNLNSVISSIRYFNKKENIRSELQATLIAHVKLLYKCKTSPEKQAVFKQLKSEIIRIKEIPTENSIYEDLDLVGWITRKCG